MAGRRPAASPRLHGRPRLLNAEQSSSLAVVGRHVLLRWCVHRCHGWGRYAWLLHLLRLLAPVSVARVPAVTRAVPIKVWNAARLVTIRTGCAFAIEILRKPVTGGSSDAEAIAPIAITIQVSAIIVEPVGKRAVTH